MTHSTSAPTTLTLSINGETHTTDETTLSAVLATLATGDQFAVAKNGEFVPKSQHANTELNNGDTLDIVTPVGGG